MTRNTRRHLSEALLSRIIPASEGPSTQISLRVPTGLLKRVDAVAKASGHDRSAVLLYLIRWGCTEYENEQAELAKRGGDAK